MEINLQGLKMSKPLTTTSNRNFFDGAPSFTLKHRILRFFWSISWGLLASWTPPQLNRWRIFLLNLFGAKIHATARVYGKAKIWYPPNLTMHAYSVLGPNANCYCMNSVTIGEKSVISQGAHLCGGTHDISDPHFQLITKPIIIESRAWVAAEAFIGPGVTVGKSAVIGARSVLFKDASQNGVYIGNPAILIKHRSIQP